MRKGLLKFIAVLMLVPILILSGCGKDKTEKQVEKPKTITLVDNVGRKVELPHPVKKAVVANRYNSELIRACGAIDGVIAVDMGTAQDREYWKKFDPKNTIGKGATDLNYEKIAQLGAEVLILPANGSYKEAEKKLEPFGIKVFVISGYDTGDFKNQVTNIGKMFDKEKGAEKFIKYFNEPIEYIKTALKDVKKKTVYFESTTEYNTSFPGDYYANMINYSGGVNIFEDATKDMHGKKVDSEEVIKRNPDFIFKNVTPDKAIKGTGLYEAPSKELMEKTIENIKKRPGWDEIKAVKNNNVYTMSQFGHGGASKLIGAVYMAKWMYPEQLKDLDPDEIYRQWLEDFQGFKNLKGHFYPEIKK
ncbi:ABC transporter substrate-binding protein [Clostridium lundense]|uniref:ABC transporter substrate-binding protein n=1 Tax=Clostridium lundense TaxID=319475 RepID=UPI000487B1FD|nr:ABC transporter substrate-binding protein [Clostridium lundense]